MKHRYIYRIFGTLLALTAVSCALEGAEECIPCNKVRTVGVRLAGTLPVAGLETPLYLFRRAAGTQDDYVFDRSLGSVADGETLKLTLAELKSSDYRFLMVAQPAGASQLSLRTAAGSPFAPGAVWSDLRLASGTGSVSTDCYCGFTDRSGDEILLDGSIRLTLTRVAGQMLFDFFRTSGSLSSPEDIRSADVLSVIDRVAQIDIEYANPTTALRFGADGRLEPAAVAAQPIRRSIVPDATDFRVALPQADKGLAAGEVKGSLRIEGAALLPSDSKVRVRIVFTYYDTTPACGNDHPGDHVAGCYDRRQLTLDLPAAASDEGLPVAADFFTVNRAGLLCDRIIDVPASGGFETGFDWL